MSKMLDDWKKQMIEWVKDKKNLGECLNCNKMRKLMNKFGIDIGDVIEDE